MPHPNLLNNKHISSTKKKLKRTFCEKKRGQKLIYESQTGRLALHRSIMLTIDLQGEQTFDEDNEVTADDYDDHGDP